MAKFVRRQECHNRDLEEILTLTVRFFGGVLKVHHGGTQRDRIKRQHRDFSACCRRIRKRGFCVYIGIHQRAEEVHHRDLLHMRALFISYSNRVFTRSYCGIPMRYT
jgi:hypothetical protein